MIEAPLPLPPLREDLHLLPGPAAADGSATWTIFDPLRNRYFRVGRIAFELLARWGVGEARTLLAKVAGETTLRPGVAELEGLLRFLKANGLLWHPGPADVEELRRQAAAVRSTPLKQLIHHYLFFRLPLVRPDRFLSRTLPRVEFLYRPAAGWTVLLLTLFGLLLAGRQWDQFLHTFLHFFSLEGMAWYGAALAVTKVIHELGHAYTAKRYGCRIPTMGIAFLVMWPVLYTDTSDAWRLVERRQRLAIGAAGMAAELAVAGLATLAWSFLPDGPLRSAAFFLATVSWVMTLTINLSPLMRFDGYYLLADWLGIENLQPRAFALARWRLREALFAFGEPPPEGLPPRTRRIVTLYAYTTWTYRLFLFIGIALLVYHLFFKLLGIVLFAIEVGWFVALPMWSELREWWRRRDRIRLNRHTLTLLAALAAAGALLIVPWHGRVELPAVARAAQYAVIYPETPARIEEIRVARHQRVAAGDLLFRLASPQLDSELRRRDSNIELLNLRLRRQTASSEERQNLLVLHQELASNLAARAGLLERRRQLELRAPFAGTAVEVSEGLRPGLWVKKSQPLARLTAPAGGEVVAYVAEAELDRVAVGVTARFYPDDPARPAFDATVGDIAPAASRTLDQPYLASTHGGGVAVEEEKEGTPTPHGAFYRVTMAVAGAPPERVVRGVAVVAGEAQSLLSRAWRQVAAVAIRESGF